MTLLDVIRDRLDYTGTKRVCNRGECGACTIILDGKTILACSMFALDADGAEIETVEGLADGDQLHPIQESFVKHDALQCGFCTSGFIVSSKALLNENPSPTMDEIKKGISGNLCRCGTYPNIFKAVDEAAKNMQKGG
jgi:xanthine dehydrogenase YagT iron-sulfur-binding subunit